MKKMKDEPYGDGVAEQLLSMCTSRYSYQPPSNMMRARRRDANVRPNRWLDKKSSRGMLFENEELRLRTIEINAEVERGQGDIKKLKRQNEQLKREIWNLRDEYDKLESHCRRIKNKDESEGEEDDYDEYDDNQEREKRAEDDDNRQNAKIQSCSDYEDDEKKPLEDQPETGKDFDTSNKDSSDNELAKEEKNEADVIIIPATGECDNNWQNTQGYGTDGYTTEDSCEGCHRRYTPGSGSQRCTPRRRVVSGGLNRQGSFSSNECSPNRLSLPVGLLEHGAVDGNCCQAADEQQHECGPQFGGPWWVLTPVTMPAVDCACTSHDFMSHKAPLAPRPPPPPVPWSGSTATITEAAATPAAAQNQQWAIAPYRSKELTKSTPALPVNGTPKTPRRRAPPPPPPKPTCEQVVCRAASVLMDSGTTRRSVTFHSDSVTYIPPTPVNPGPLQAATHIPHKNTYVPENCPHDNDPRTCICSLHAQATFEESTDTVLMVRGLQRVPGLISRELIDALENRLGPTLMRQSIRGICLHQARPSATVIAASVSVMRKDVALRLLLTGLEIRGEMLQLEEENALCPSKWRSPDDTPDNSHVLLVSGVTHQVSDTSVRTAVMRACGLRATQVRRHVYKGVDTGERLVRVAPPCMSYARLQAAGAGSSGTIITEAVADCSINSGSDSESKYRTHLSVQLRRPATGSPTVDCVTEQRTIRSASPIRPVSLTGPANQVLLTEATEVVRIESAAAARQQATPPSRRLSRSAPQGVRVLPSHCNGNVAPPPYTPPPNPMRPQSNPPPPPPPVPSVPSRKAPAPQPKPSIAIEAAVVASTNSSAAREESKHMRKSKSQEESGSSAAASPTSNKTAHKKPSQNGGILRRAASKDADTQPNSKGKSRSVSVESGARTSAPQRRKNGVFERPNSEDLLLDGRSSISSREGSNQLVVPQAQQSGGSLPWCACWGNGCL